MRLLFALLLPTTLPCEKEVVSRHSLVRGTAQFDRALLIGDRN